MTGLLLKDDHALEGDEDVASLRVFQIAEGCAFLEESMKVIIFCFTLKPDYKVTLCSIDIFGSRRWVSVVQTKMPITSIHFISNRICNPWHWVLFGQLEGSPILFLLSLEVSGTSGTMSRYIYIYMSTTWRTQSQYIIFRLYFGKIHSFASDFISEGSFQPEEFSKVLF